MAKTKKPTGLSITRKNDKYTFKWKVGEKYDKDQQLKYRTHNTGAKWNSWHSIDIGKTTTTKAVTINTGTKNKVEFAVRGKTAANGWSEWETEIMTLKVPNNPKASAQLSDSLSNVTTFSYSISAKDNDKKPFSKLIWETILVPEAASTKGETYKTKFKSGQTGWATGETTSTSGTKPVTEDTATIAGKSYTRFFRVRAKGLAGYSSWVYSYHVYATPKAAVIKKAEVVENNSGGTNIKVTWEAASSAAYPIDSTSIEYSLTVPDSGMTCPSGASWTEADVSRDTSGADAAAFVIDNVLGDNECCFVRVNTKHDRNITYGNPKMGAVGRLSSPSELSVQTNDSTYTATVTATNNSEVPDSYLVVMYRAGEDPWNTLNVGIIEHGQNSVTVQCPDWSVESAISFGVYACVGSKTAKTRSDGVGSYEIDAKMTSDVLWDNGAVTKAPTGVTAEATSIPGTIRVAWNWDWAAADSAVLSWSDHEDAWESTDEPDEYVISKIHAAQWNISGLETGQKWYVRVRLTRGEESITYGPWSEMVTVDLSSAPSIPVLVLSEEVITADGEVTASWAYTSTDGTPQSYAEVCEATIDSEGITYGNIIAHAETAQHVTVDASAAGWQSGETHYLCVRVVSGSGHVSDEWSDPVPINIAEELVCTITGTSLENVTVVDDEEESITRSVLSLTQMPLTVAVSGAGNDGTTTVAVERAADYHMARPDETSFNGFEGETVALVEGSSVTIGLDSLIGALDDGAPYRIVATVQDGYGQSALAELDFEVHWTHQAVMPEASVEIDNLNKIAKITAVQPEEADEGDTFDIYRLSADRPELIIENGEWGTVYVDPYPAIGVHGGHRVVFKTINGDYITEDNEPAWIDLTEEDGDILNVPGHLIDCDGETIALDYDLDLSSSWEKDFVETRYLGGSIQGDWNPAVGRKVSAKSSIQAVRDPDTVSALRRLAMFPGICHVRTRDGSSYAADVQVSEDYSNGKIANFSLEITRVDSEGLDGLTFSQWAEEES